MATKNKGGRPRVELTKAQIKEVEQISAYLTCEQISDYFGISHTTFQDIRKRQPDVSLAYKKGRTKKILDYAKLLESKANGTNTEADSTSTIFYLKTQAGWSSGNNTRINLDIPKNATATDILDHLITKIGKQEINLSDVKQIADLAQMKQQILNNSPEEAQAPAGPSDEFVLEHIEKFNEAMRHINEHRAKEGENE